MGAALSSSDECHEGDRLIIDRTLVDELRAQPLSAVDEAVSNYRDLYPDVMAMDVAQFEDTFGMLLEDVESHFSSTF